jgi:hypothetical protein
MSLAANGPRLPLLVINQDNNAYVWWPTTFRCNRLFISVVGTHPLDHFEYDRLTNLV